MERVKIWLWWQIIASLLLIETGTDPENVYQFFFVNMDDRVIVNLHACRLSKPVDFT